MLLIGGDFNAHASLGFSYHDKTNRNGQYLKDFADEFNLGIGNTTFQKPKRKLWTWRSPKGDLSQIDYCLYRKRWRNSVSDCQAFSSSSPIGSDHRRVTSTIKLSLRAPKTRGPDKLYWRTLNNDTPLANAIDDIISSKYNDLIQEEQSYPNCVRICNDAGKEVLPKKPAADKLENTAPVTSKK